MQPEQFFDPSTGQKHLNAKLKRGTVGEKDLKKIANILGIIYEQSFTLPNGDKIELTN